MWWGLGFLLGIAFVQNRAQLPPDSLGLVLAIALLVLGLLSRVLRLWTTLGRFHYWVGVRSRFFLRLWAGLISFCLAMSYASYLGNLRMMDVLQSAHENKTSQVHVRVNSLALYSDNAVQFDAQVIHSPFIEKGIPRSIRIFWPQIPGLHLYQTPKATVMPEVRPGQIWAMSLLLKRPNTLINPGGFDNETFLFRENIRALGTVKNTPQLLGEQQTWFTFIQSMRHDLRQKMQVYLKDKRYGPILLALVMGDQQSIPQEDWQLFNRVGMTHLVSISGSHITMLSGMAMVGLLYLFKRLSWRSKPLGEWVDIHLLATGIGLIVAFLYCLLAGWGVPAQRTFLMLLLMYLSQVYKVSWSYAHQFVMSACIVALIDPWAILTTGFYLSFVAVAVLQMLLQTLQSPSSSQKSWLFMLKRWSILQGVITVAMMPFLIYYFHQVSLISPLVNAYAIPIIGLLITPLALLLGFLSYTQWEVLHYLATGIHFLLEKVMQLSIYLSNFSWASVEVSQVSMPILLLSGLGIVYLLLPKGLPWRSLAFVVMIPAFFLKDKPLQEGEWRIIVFDIGQAEAVLVQTSNHFLLFDTGVRSAANNDSAIRVLLPAFKALGVKQLDVLVVSHSDLDHSGGLSSLVQSMPIRHMYASFRVNQFLDKEELLLQKTLKSKNPQLQFSFCHSGEVFHYDGVMFRFLNEDVSLKGKSSNAQSCVLSLEGRYHNALLTGDITVEQEQKMLDEHTKEKIVLAKHLYAPPYHLVQVPHHGSLSSSSTDFIDWTKAWIAIAQTGFQNRFKHPHPVVQQRWQAYGSLFLNTAITGSVTVDSNAQGLSYSLLREAKRRYWHR